MNESPHVPPEAMVEWREAFKKGYDAALVRLIDDICDATEGKEDETEKKED